MKAILPILAAIAGLCLCADLSPASDYGRARVIIERVRTVPDERVERVIIEEQPAIVERVELVERPVYVQRVQIQRIEVERVRRLEVFDRRSVLDIRVRRGLFRTRTEINFRR